MQRLTGQSVVEFIRDIRPGRVTQRLTSTLLLVADVACQAGPQDLKHFRLVFQNLHQTLPFEYARQHRAGESAAAPTASI